MALLSDFCQEIAEEYDEDALAVSGSNSESSRDNKRRRNKATRSGRNKRKDRRSHSKSSDKRQVVSNYCDNPCKYCCKYRQVAVHQAKEEAWKLTVFRSKRVCEEMGIKWKPAYKFESNSEDESGSE